MPSSTALKRSIRTSSFAAAILAIVVVAVGYCGWRIYIDRQTAATAAFDIAMKAYSGRIGAAPDPNDPSEPFYPTEAARSEDAVQKFSVVAEKYPSTNPGRLAAYYAALCYEDLERKNQALEQLKKISTGNDKELAAMAQYQTGVIYARTGRPTKRSRFFARCRTSPRSLCRARSLSWSLPRLYARAIRRKPPACISR